MRASRSAVFFPPLFTLALFLAAALSPALSRAQTAGTAYLGLNNFLTTNQYLVSANKLAFLMLQGDGNLVEYLGSGPADNHGMVWSSGRTGPGGKFCLLSQGDGNLCVYPGEDPVHHAGPALWCSGPHPGGDSYFTALQDDGNLVTYHGTAAAPRGYVWGNGAHVSLAQVLTQLTSVDPLVTGARIILQSQATNCIGAGNAGQYSIPYVADFIPVNGAFAANRVWSDVQMGDLLTVERVATVCYSVAIVRLKTAAGQYLTSGDDMRLAPGGDAAHAASIAIGRITDGQFLLEGYQSGQSCADLQNQLNYYVVDNGYCGGDKDHDGTTPQGSRLTRNVMLNYRTQYPPDYLKIYKAP